MKFNRYVIRLYKNNFVSSGTNKILIYRENISPNETFLQIVSNSVLSGKKTYSLNYFESNEI